MAFFVALWVLCCPASSRADRPTQDKVPRPWAKTVPASEQALALEIFERGNETFVVGDYATALALYKQALAHWDHPAIHFNASQALVHLDRPIEALVEVEQALHYGVTPLGEDVFLQASTHRKLLEQQLVRLMVTSNEPGAQLFLDGVPLFLGPGRAERVLLPGGHQVVARKPGRLTTTEDLMLLPGKPTAIAIATHDIPPSRLERRWTAWKPWAAVGSGAAVALLGGGFQLRSSRHMEQYDQEVLNLCPNGCVAAGLPAATRKLEQKAQRENIAGVALLGVGGAAILTGVVLVILNQPRAFEGVTDVRVTPVIANGASTIQMSLSF